MLPLASAFLSVALAAGEGSGDSRATQLAALRREVESLAAQLSDEKEEARSRMRATLAQRMEVEAQLRREELRLTQATDEAVSRRARVDSQQALDAQLGPIVVAAIDRVQGAVEGGLPYRLAERRGELEALARGVAAGEAKPAAALARLWSFAEDELRLGREVGLDRQVVPMGGADVLADVARLGMAAMYCKTEGGRVNLARRGRDGWEWIAIDEPGERTQVQALFDKLKHGVRSGSFTLPRLLGGSAA